MNILSIRPYLSALIQVLVWITLGVMLLILHPLSWNIGLPTQFWILQGIIFCAYVGLYYLNAKVWVPKFLFKNKSWLFIFLALASGIFIYIVIDYAGSWLNLPELVYQATHPNGGEGRHRSGRGGWINPVTLFFVGMILLILFISTSVAALQRYQLEANTRQELEKAKISSELSFLKAQINPHFFFNTLNNIYALTMFNVSLAQQALHTLSRMMRYVLYDTAERTLLSKELNFIQDYIDLMKLRLTDKVSIQFDQPVNLKDVPIAPMLLLPFIENAFKYGISTENHSSIYIAITQSPATLNFTVRNTLFSQKRVALEESNGIGLVNTRRRLDLLYPGQYTLVINEKTPENEYAVNLTLTV